MTTTLQAIVSGVYIVPPIGDGIGADPVSEAQVTFEGFAGDRHAGMTMKSNSRTPFYTRGTEIWNNRQVTIVSVEELAVVAPRMGIPEILPEWLGANLALSGIPELSHLPPGTRLFFPGEATLIVQVENGPCLVAGKEIQEHHPEIPDLGPQFPKQALHLRGIAACVERPGVIRTGDVVKVMIPEQYLYKE
jgi:hypothetical protein